MENLISEPNYDQDIYEQRGLRLQNGECPECGSILDHGEGCQLCRCCGWSACEY